MTKTKNENPFLPLPEFIRKGFIIYVLLSQAIIPFFSYVIYGETESNTFSRLFLDVVYHAIILIPFVFYDKNKFGLFHPIIFTPLFLFAKARMKNVSSVFLDLFKFNPIYNDVNNVMLENADQFELSNYELYIKLCMVVYIASKYLSFYLFPYVKTVKFYDNKTFEQVKSKLILVVVFAFAVSIIFFMSRGGITSHFNSFGHDRLAQMKGKGIIVVLMNLSSLACLIWISFDKIVLKNRMFWMVFVLSLAITFLSTGSRSSILFSVLSMLLIWVLKTQKLPNITISLALPVFAFLVISMLGQLRNSTFSGKEVDWDILTNFSVEKNAEFLQKEIKSRNGDKTSDLPIMAYGIEQEGLLLGKSYLSAILFFIPRFIWKDKPTPVGFYAGTLLMKSRGGIPPSIAMEAYWNFHYVGLVIIGFIDGLMVSFMANFFRKNYKQNASIVLYTILLMKFVPESNVLIHCFQEISSVLIIYYLLNLITFKKKIQFNELQK